MKIFRAIHNPGLDLSLVRALAKENVTVEHVAAPEQADLIVLFEKGKDFGVKLDDAAELLGLAIPKVIVRLEGGTDDNATAIVRPVLEDGKLRVKLSEVVAAVKRFTGPEFEIVDDTDPPPAAANAHSAPDPPAVPVAAELADTTVEVHPDPVSVNGPARTLRDRLEPVLSITLQNSAAFLRPDKLVVFKPLKNGVGSTTLCACVVNALAGIGAVHGDPHRTGWVYYGSSLEEAAAGGHYVAAAAAAGQLVILDDPDMATPADAMVAVIDDSILSFNALKAALDGGFVPDLVVINRVRGGVTDAVFHKEFPNVARWATVVDNYDACIRGQNESKPPTEFSPDLARDTGKLVAGIRAILAL